MLVEFTELDEEFVDLEEELPEGPWFVLKPPVLTEPELVLEPEPEPESELELVVVLLLVVVVVLLPEFEFPELPEPPETELRVPTLF